MLGLQDVVAPEPDSADGIVMVIVVSDGIVVTANFLLSKSVEPKSELVIDEKLSSKIMSPTFSMLCALAKVMVTVDDPLVVVNALDSVVVDLIGCMS